MLVHLFCDPRVENHQDVTVTNDGATILEKMDVNHQASEASVLPKHLGP